MNMDIGVHCDRFQMVFCLSLKLLFTFSEDEDIPPCVPVLAQYHYVRWFYVVARKVALKS